MPTTKSNLCPLPWLGIYAATDGHMQTCAVAQSAITEVSAVPTPEIFSQQVRNSTLMKQLRQDFMAGVRPKHCQSCWRSEDAGITSYRQYHRADFPDFEAEAIPETRSDGTTTVATRLYDIRPGNLCNLKCRMCNPRLSSLWGADQEFLTGEKFSNKDYSWAENPDRWENLFANVLVSLESHPDVTLMFAGGEPLISKSHGEFLKSCVDARLASRIKLRYQSNGTVLPDSLVQLWSHFLSVRVGISLDGVQKINEYIRHPSQWSTVEKNLQTLVSLDHVYVWIQPCVTIYNTFDFPELFRWSLHHPQNFQGQRVELEVHGHIVHSPEQLNIQKLPVSVIDQLETRFKQFFEEHLSDANADQDRQLLLESYRKFMSGIISYARLGEEHGRLEEFWSFTEKLDGRRQESFSAASPQWHDILSLATKT